MKASNSGFKKVSLIAASGMISQILPNVQAAVSLTMTLLSYINSIKVGMACSTSGFNVAVSRPPNIEPNAMREASLNLRGKEQRRASVKGKHWKNNHHYLQFSDFMLSLMNGRTYGTISSSQQVAKSIKQTPAALLGFQSSSSSSSSCFVSFWSRIGTINWSAPVKTEWTK